MAELNKTALQQLLYKEAQGTLTPNEQQLLDDWNSNFHLVEKDLEVFKDSKHEHLVKLRLLNRIMDGGDTEKTPYTKIIKFNKLFRWSAVAAVFLLALGYGAFQFTKNIGQEVNYTAVKKEMTSPLNPAVKKIVLADGSIVILNKGSHLDYPEKFIGNSREVYLKGEAYFDIHHDAKKPFLVHADKLTTRVLGTAFNIKTGGKDNTVEVTVSRGKVAVSDQKKTLAVLLPDQKISYNPHSQLALKTTTNSKLVTLWKEEDLVLNNIVMEQAVNILEQRYGVKINLATDQIADCKFTAYFLNTTSIDQVLSVISKLNNLSYTKNKNGAYILSGNGCEQPKD